MGDAYDEALRKIAALERENTDLRMMAGAAKMRVGLLESLVLDWAMAPCAVCDPWDEHFACEHFDGHDCTLGIRMTELGIEVDE